MAKSNNKDRIKIEARGKTRITNEDLVCRDCTYKLDDSEALGNTSRCSKFTSKPSNVLLGGDCDEYQRKK